MDELDLTEKSPRVSAETGPVLFTETVEPWAMSLPVVEAVPLSPGRAALGTKTGIAALESRARGTAPPPIPTAGSVDIGFDSEPFEKLDSEMLAKPEARVAPRCEAEMIDRVDESWVMDKVEPAEVAPPPDDKPLTWSFEKPDFTEEESTRDVGSTRLGTPAITPFVNASAFAPEPTRAVDPNLFGRRIEAAAFEADATYDAEALGRAADALALAESKRAESDSAIRVAPPRVDPLARTALALDATPADLARAVDALAPRTDPSFARKPATLPPPIPSAGRPPSSASIPLLRATSQGVAVAMKWDLSSSASIGLPPVSKPGIVLPTAWGGSSASIAIPDATPLATEPSQPNIVIESEKQRPSLPAPSQAWLRNSISPRHTGHTPAVVFDEASASVRAPVEDMSTGALVKANRSPLLKIAAILGGVAVASGAIAFAVTRGSDSSAPAAEIAASPQPVVAPTPVPPTPAKHVATPVAPTPPAEIAAIAQPAPPAVAAIAQPTATQPNTAQPSTAQPPAPPQIATTAGTPIAGAPTVAVTPQLLTVPITSTPTGAIATLVVDGRATVLGPTPLNVILDPSRGYDIVLAMRDQPTRIKHIAPDTRAIAVDLAMPEVAEVAAPKAAPAKAAAPTPTKSVATTAPATKSPATAPTTKSVATPATKSVAPATKPATAPATKSAATTAPATKPAAFPTTKSTAAPAQHTATTAAPAPATKSPAKTPPVPAPAAPTARTAKPAAVAVAGANTGVLMVSSKPPCEIVVDGRPTHLMTPQRQMVLPAGPHTITLLNPTQHVSNSTKIEILSGLPSRLIKDFTH